MKKSKLAALPPWLLLLVSESAGHVAAYSSVSRVTQLVSSQAFTIPSLRSSTLISATTEGIPGKENNAMEFLRKVGRVGRNTDFTNALGVDEGQSGGKIAGKWGQGKAVKKALAAYKACTDSGVIDDLTEEFPITCSGTEWAGVTDRVMGGVSSGTLARELYHGRTANVLRAHVSLENGGGFVQMATDLALDPSLSSLVNASSFDGIQAELFYQGDEETDDFNVHLKTVNCQRQFSSYRSTFALPRGEWTKVQIPWAKFDGYGWGAVENNFDPSSLRRIGIVSIGKEVEVTLALSFVGFYKD